MQRRKEREQCMSKRLERRSRRGKGSAAQRGKGAAKWRMVKRTGKRSKREREQHAHREEKHSKRGG